MTKEQLFTDEIRRVAHWSNDATDDALQILEIFNFELYDETRVQHLMAWTENAGRALELAREALDSLRHMLEEGDLNHD